MRRQTAAPLPRRKRSNSEQTAGLTSLPHGVWMGLCGLEVVAAIALLVPAVSKRLGRRAAPWRGRVVVAALGGLLGWGHFSLWPIAPTT